MATKPRRTLLTSLLGMVTMTMIGAGLSADASSAPAESRDRTGPLRIMLTNDDGYAAPGLVALRDALEANGYLVTVVAPLTNQSGSSARATFQGDLRVSHPDASTYAVDGSPADAVEVGLSAVFAADAPDLVISGSNAGQNVAAAVIHSGTVGAAVTAIVDGVPAIAVSTEQALHPPYAETAVFVVRLVEALERRARASLLPTGIGLNINYPVVEAGERPRPQLTRIGSGFLDLTYSGQLPPVGETSPLRIGVDLSVPETQPMADVTALSHDHVSVSMIEGDYHTDSGLARRDARRLIAALRD